MRLRRRPPPQGLEEVLSRNAGTYSLLPNDLREELHGYINVFLNEKRFRGGRDRVFLRERCCHAEEIAGSVRSTEKVLLGQPGVLVQG